MGTYSPFSGKPHRTVFIPDPKIPVGGMQTYQILQPVATHFRPATCEEVECEKFVNGWKVRVNDLDELMLAAMRSSGRKYKVVDEGPGQTFWYFEAGQACFRSGQHRIPLGRDQIFLKRGGDWRALGTPNRFTRAADWVDDFANHQIKIQERMERG